MATAKILIRSAYSPKLKSTIDTGPGVAKQSPKDECDVNQILARFQQTGVLQHRQDFEAQYDDATGIDFQTAMNLVISSQKMFEELPATARRKFNDSPEIFMNFVNDPANLPEMIKMGLAVDTTPKPETPILVTMVDPIKPSSEPV